MVLNSENDIGLLASCNHFGVSGIAAVLDRVPYHVRHDLPQSRGVPFSARVAERFEAQWPIQVRCSKLIEHVATKILKVCSSGSYGHAAAEASRGEIEQIVDHPGHHLRKAGHVRRDACGLLIELPRSRQQAR